MRYLTRFLLETTPWAEEVAQESAYLDFLRHTVVPEVGYRLIQQDILMMGYESDVSKFNMAEKIMMITANNSYSLTHVKIDEET